MKKQILWITLFAAAAYAGGLAAETINAAGATFPAPIYQKWFEEFHKSASRHPDQLSVHRFGRRHPPAHRRHGGFRRLRHADDRRADCRRSPSTKFCTSRPCWAASCRPTTFRASGSLKFTARRWPASTLGRSRSGTMPRLTKDNPGVKLPNDDITVVHRSDGSGTTFVWTDYLSKVSPEWKTRSAPTLGELAGGLGRQGQRRRGRAGKADARLHRLRRIDLRRPEQDGYG